MGVNSLPKTLTGQRRDYDLNPGPSVPESSTLTTRLPSQHYELVKENYRRNLIRTFGATRIYNSHYFRYLLS